MDPQKGHDLAKLSTCTTCEMSEDFSASEYTNPTHQGLTIFM
jgi:hypothetical protein